MKNTFFTVLLTLSVSLFAQEPPAFLNGISYSVETLTTEDGERFTCYTIDNPEEWAKMNKRFKRMGRLYPFVNEGIVFGLKRSGKWEVLRSWAWGFRQFRIYEAD